MGGTVDNISGSVDRTYRLIKASTRQLFTGMLKITALSIAVSMAGLLIAAVLFFMLNPGLVSSLSSGTYLPAFSGQLLQSLIILIPLLMIIGFVSEAITSVSYNLVDNIAKKKPTAIIGQAVTNFVPVAILNIVMLAAFIIIFSPALLAVWAGGGLAICIVLPLIIIAYILFVFFTQFAIVEVVIKRQGIMEAIRGSFLVVRSLLVETFVYDILVVIIALGMAAITQVADIVLRLIMSAFGLIGGTTGLLVGAVAYFVLYLAVATVVSAITKTVVVPLTYQFWKGGKG